GGYERPTLSVGSGDAGAADASSPKCSRAAECDDGLFCNGVEACDPGSLRADPQGCVPGNAPSCGTQQTCDEASDRCTSCTLVPDGDRDGVPARACGGDDCNDGDPEQAPNRSEVCDGKDNDCDDMIDRSRAGTSVCVATIDAGSGASDAGVDARASDASAADAGLDSGGTGMDSGAKPEAGPVDAAPEAEAAAPVVPLVSGCTMGSTQSCSSFINAWNVEVALGSYGAVMERNVGRGFEVTLHTNDTASMCAEFLALYNEPPAAIGKVCNLGDLDLTLHTVYRPARWVTGEKYPLILWANGTFWQPETYGAHLRSLASQGFIVVAPNSRFSSTGNALARALEFAIAANADTQSAFHNRIDTTKLGIMGHSQGGQAAIAFASDPRVQAVILFNGGNSASKPFLAVSGDKDIGGSSVASFQSAVAAAPKGAYLFFHMVQASSTAGHLVLVTQPERVIGATNAWWKYLLQGDAAARNWFVGTGCTLCNHASEYDFGQNGL
ncbi:MAG TPA: MopE-related protein, partial [Polyangiaceae bacterium]|nr:MopE-related protein [Polyangiaceae bacterium]